MAHSSLNTRIRIGIAGWSLPAALRSPRSVHQSLLEQYAALFNAVEINSSFYRPHRLETYQRWRGSVPDSFHFAVKVPKLITHDHRLAGCQHEIAAFMSAVSGLGNQLGALLVQLPPSFLFDATIARDFFGAVRAHTSAAIVCEARNSSWFGGAATPVLKRYEVTRAWADPVPAGCSLTGREPGQLVYRRLHGSPRMYYSAYGPDYVQDLATQIAASSIERSGVQQWCIFDNTAAGAAWSDAQLLQCRVTLASGDPDCSG